MIHTYEHVDVIHTKHAYIRGYHTSRIEANRKHREWSRIDITFIAYTRVEFSKRGNVRARVRKTGFWRFEFRVREIA